MNVRVFVVWVERDFLCLFSVMGSRTVVHAPVSETMSLREAWWSFDYV